MLKEIAYANGGMGFLKLSGGVLSIMYFIIMPLCVIYSIKKGRFMNSKMNIIFLILNSMFFLVLGIDSIVTCYRYWCH